MDMALHALIVGMLPLTRKWLPPNRQLEILQEKIGRSRLMASETMKLGVSSFVGHCAGCKDDVMQSGR